MSTEPGVLARMYKKLNEATRLAVTANELIAIFASAAALAMPSLTGVPTKYATPTTLFIVFAALIVLRRNQRCARDMIINAASCLLLFAVLVIFGSK